jgi:hypothetical protein
MSHPPPFRALAAAAAAALALAAIAAAAEGAGGDGFPYRGLSEQERGIKLIVDGRGRVKRGAFSARTDCGRRFRPFVGEFEFRAPLDRSTPARFRDEGSTVESDDVHTARYRWDIRGGRKDRRRIDGRFSVEIIFRRDGREYATCVAEDVAYSAKRSRRRD